MLLVRLLERDPLASLHFAVESEDIKRIERILARAKRNEIPKTLMIDGYYHHLTALQAALFSQKYASMIVLLKHHADPSALSHSEYVCTALHAAIKWKDLSAIRLLILSDADLTRPDGKGATPRKLAQTVGLGDFFEKIAAIHQQMDDEMLAGLHHCKVNKYVEAASCYFRIAKHWETMAQVESQAVIKQHYLAEALRCYGQAKACSQNGRDVQGVIEAETQEACIEHMMKALKKPKLHSIVNRFMHFKAKSEQEPTQVDESQPLLPRPRNTPLS